MRAFEIWIGRRERGGKEIHIQISFALFKMIASSLAYSFIFLSQSTSVSPSDFNEITDLYSDDLLFLKYFYGAFCWHFQPMVRTKTNEKISRTYITPIDAPYSRMIRFIKQPENKTEKKSKDIKQSRGKRRNRLVWVRNEIPLDFFSVVKILFTI